MLTVAAKVARYFTVAVYMLVCMWAVFGVGQTSSAGGFFVAVVALLAVFVCSRGGVTLLPPPSTIVVSVNRSIVW